MSIKVRLRMRLLEKDKSPISMMKIIYIFYYFIISWSYIMKLHHQFHYFPYLSLTFKCGFTLQRSVRPTLGISNIVCTRDECTDKMEVYWHRKNNFTWLQHICPRIQKLCKFKQLPVQWHSSSNFLFAYCIAWWCIIWNEN